jgi:hypothetical protein
LSQKPQFFRRKNRRKYFKNHNIGPRSVRVARQLHLHRGILPKFYEQVSISLISVSSVCYVFGQFCILEIHMDIISFKSHWKMYLSDTSSHFSLILWLSKAILPLCI